VSNGLTQVFYFKKCSLRFLNDAQLLNTPKIILFEFPFTYVGNPLFFKKSKKGGTVWKKVNGFPFTFPQTVRLFFGFFLEYVFFIFCKLNKNWIKIKHICHLCRSLKVPFKWFHFWGLQSFVPTYFPTKISRNWHMILESINRQP
jgi:hypothetical protein